jgi:hypothetical protein
MISDELRKAFKHGRRKPKAAEPSNPIEPVSDPGDEIDPDDYAQRAADSNLLPNNSEPQALVITVLKDSAEASAVPPRGPDTPEPSNAHKIAPGATAESHGKPDVPLPPLPANAPLLEVGLHKALLSMPERVQAFLLHVPRDPPAWQYQESEAERAERQALENLGAWTG